MRLEMHINIGPIRFLRQLRDHVRAKNSSALWIAEKRQARHELTDLYPSAPVHEHVAEVEQPVEPPCRTRLLDDPNQVRTELVLMRLALSRWGRAALKVPEHTQEI